MSRTIVVFFPSSGSREQREVVKGKKVPRLFSSSFFLDMKYVGFLFMFERIKTRGSRFEKESENDRRFYSSVSLFLPSIFDDHVSLSHIT